jgi:hypothetical protein
LYNGYGFSVERPNSGDTLWCTPGNVDAAPYRKERKKVRKRGQIDVSDPWCVLMIAGLLVFAWAMHSRAQRGWLLEELKVHTFDEAIDVFRNIRAEHDIVTEDLDHQYSLNERCKIRERAWKEQVNLLQNATRKASHRAILDKYVRRVCHRTIP